MTRRPPRSTLFPTPPLFGREVGRVDPAADAEFSSRRADDGEVANHERGERHGLADGRLRRLALPYHLAGRAIEREDARRSEEHTSELQSPDHLVCRLLLEKK